MNRLFFVLVVFGAHACGECPRGVLANEPKATAANAAAIAFIEEHWGRVSRAADGESLIVRLRNPLDPEKTLARLADAGQIRKLVIECDVGPTPESLRHLASLRGLSTLFFSSQTAQGDSLAFLSALSELQMLVLEMPRGGDAAMRHVVSLKNLRVLDLVCVPASDDGLANMERLSNLAILRMNGVEIHGDGLSHLTGLDHLSTLSIMGMGRCLELRTFPRLKSLRSLDLRLANVAPDAISGIASNNGVKSLELWATDLGGEGLRTLLAGLPGLVRLEVGNMKIFEKDVRAISALKEIREVGLHDKTVTDATIADLGNAQLRRLDLSRTEITDEGLRRLASMEGLEYLDVSDTKITDSGLDVLTRMSRLTELRLRSTQITDRGIKMLAKCTNLEYLDLLETKVTYEGLPQLASLKRLRWLRIPRHIGDEMAQNLRSQLPEAEVTTTRW